MFLFPLLHAFNETISCTTSNNIKVNIKQKLFKCSFFLSLVVGSGATWDDQKNKKIKKKIIVKKPSKP